MKSGFSTDFSMVRSQCSEHKLRNFKARYLTKKQTIREYSCFGNLAQKL